MPIVSLFSVGVAVSTSLRLSITCGWHIINVNICHLLIYFTVQVIFLFWKDDGYDDDDTRSFVTVECGIQRKLPWHIPQFKWLDSLQWFEILKLLIISIYIRLNLYYNTNVHCSYTYVSTKRFTYICVWICTYICHHVFVFMFTLRTLHTNVVSALLCIHLFNQHTNINMQISTFVQFVRIAFNHFNSHVKKRLNAKRINTAPSVNWKSSTS